MKTGTARPTFVKPGMCVFCASEDRADVPAVGYGKVLTAKWGIALCYLHLREAAALGWETHQRGIDDYAEGVWEDAE